MLLSDLLRFLAAFIRHPGQVGAIVPSSPALARAMVAGLTLGVDETIIELGPGTGPFTKAIAGILPERSYYLGIERDPAFIEILRRRFTGLHFVAGSAEQALSFHQEAKLPPVKAVVCGLPFASLASSVQDKIIDALDLMLASGCMFRTFQYVHAFALPAAVRFRRCMDDRFGSHTRSRPVMRNVPPAFVLTWKRGP